MAIPIKWTCWESGIMCWTIMCPKRCWHGSTSWDSHSSPWHRKSLATKRSLSPSTRGTSWKVLKRLSRANCGSSPCSSAQTQVNSNSNWLKLTLRSRSKSTARVLMSNWMPGANRSCGSTSPRSAGKEWLLRLKKDCCHLATMLLSSQMHHLYPKVKKYHLQLKCRLCPLLPIYPTLKHWIWSRQALLLSKSKWQTQKFSIKWTGTSICS